MASVESDEAVLMIREGLWRIEGIHNFMRLTGVVMERVICLPCQDGRPQLDDLNEYCWRTVWRYLLLEDVCCSGRLKTSRTGCSPTKDAASVISVLRSSAGAFQ